MSVIGVGVATSDGAAALNPNVICDARTKALKTHSLSDRSRERTESPRIEEVELPHLEKWELSDLPLEGCPMVVSFLATLGVENSEMLEDTLHIFVY